jgi:glycerol-1-phosphate dehydrogenase [NAD(P)+]
VVADIDVIKNAPPEMTASGYADLLAKITSGADWIVADALGIEPIHPQAWDTVQNGLHESLAHPLDIARLTKGLMMGGFAMQTMMSSRPASGAEHQFSHLWDMQHHTHNGKAPSHGFKVGVATLAVAELYVRIFRQIVDVNYAISTWRPWEAIEADIRQLFDVEELRDKAIEESRAKFRSKEDTREILTTLKRDWELIAGKVLEQLPSPKVIGQMLRDAGAPTDPEQIGISKQRLRDSFRQAYHIRRRFTILDVSVMTGLLDHCLSGEGK